ncbi:MAG: carboxypeptidase regulatory-like domain-containing protein [Planctomycetota bacterium]
MRKRPDPTASLAMVVAAAVVAGALLALSEGSQVPRTALAVERLETASLTVEGVDVPVSEVMERAIAAPAPLDDGIEVAAVAPQAHLVVFDAATGLGVDGVTVTLAGRVERFEALRGQPIVLDLQTPDQHLEIGAAGFRSQTITVDGEKVYAVRLSRSTTLRGVVRDADGAPIPHASVRLIASEDTDAVPSRDIVGRPTLRRTDESGAFTFDALQPGVYRTSVDIAGVTHLSRPLALRDGEWAQADHRLVTSTALSVQVDTPGGLPAERARLLIQRAGTAAPVTRYTDDHGRAAIRPLPAGSYRLTVQSAEGTSHPRAFTIEEAGQGLVDLHVRLQAESLSPAD